VGAQSCDFRKNSKFYNSKPEVEIDFIPTALITFRDEHRDEFAPGGVTTYLDRKSATPPDVAAYDRRYARRRLELGLTKVGRNLNFYEPWD